MVVAALAVWPILGLSAAAPLHFEGDVTAGDGDYTLVTFDVPAGTVEIQVDHTDGSDADILDWGLWGPDGFRGWGGGLIDPAIVGVDASSRGYLPGPITPGTWTVVVGEAKLPTGTGHYVIDVTLRTAATLTPVARAAPGTRATSTSTTARAATRARRSTTTWRWRARAGSTSSS
jgi:hypothetical protein